MFRKNPKKKKIMFSFIIKKIGVIMTKIIKKN